MGSKSASDRSKWMAAFQDKKLIDLHLPGSHNSAAYAPFCTNSFKSFPQSLAQCQELTIAEQLKAGVRVLDLRVTISNQRVDDGNGFARLEVDDVVTAHTFICRRLSYDLLEVKEFVEANPSEVVILKVTRDHCNAEALSSKMSNRERVCLDGTLAIEGIERYQIVADEIIKYIPASMCISQTEFASKTLKDLGGRVLLTTPHAEILYLEGLLYSGFVKREDVFDEDPAGGGGEHEAYNKQKLTTNLKDRLLSVVNQADKLKQVNGEITPRTENGIWQAILVMVGQAAAFRAGFLINDYEGTGYLRGLASEANSVEEVLSELGFLRTFHVLTHDYIQDRIVERILARNQSTYVIQGFADTASGPVEFIGIESPDKSRRMTILFDGSIQESYVPADDLGIGEVHNRKDADATPQPPYIFRLQPDGSLLIRNGRGDLTTYSSQTSSNTPITIGRTNDSGVTILDSKHTVLWPK